MNAVMSVRLMTIAAGLALAAAGVLPAVGRSARAAAPMPSATSPLGISTAVRAPDPNPGSDPDPGLGPSPDPSSQRPAEPPLPFEDSAPRRALVRLDFEENESFPREIPLGWQRVLTSRSGPPGFPDFGTVEAVRGVGRRSGDSDGGWAVRFRVDGASMALACDPRRVTATPGAQLLASAWARTSGLRHAGGRLSLQFANAQGEPFGPIHSSEVVRSESGWRRLRVVPPVAPEGTAGAVVWLEVVQPRALKSGDEARFEVAPSDVRGEALFDDVEVWQLPTVTFEAEGLGVVQPGGRPRLSVRCNDPASATTIAAIRVRDASGVDVHAETAELDAGRARVLTMPALPTGWYEAEARFTSGAEVVATRHARFAILPNDPFEPDEPPRFGVSLGSLRMPIDPALDLARAAFVVLPAWSAETDSRTPRNELERLRAMVSRLLDRRVEPMFRLAAVPAPLAREQRVDVDDVAGLFALDESRWLPALEPWLLAFGQQVDEWVLGDAPAAGDPAAVARDVESVASAMGRAIAGPSVGLPWLPSEPFAGPVARAMTAGRHTLELVADPAWRESAAEAYAGFPTGPRGMVRIVPLPPGLVDEYSRAIDIAVRAIDAWRAGFDSVSVDVRADSMPPIPGPPLELAAWRQISTRLCGRNFVREVPVAEGVRAILADGPRGTVLVVWSEAAGDVEVSVDLGSAPVAATDLWGRSSTIPPAPEGHRIRIGREPIFIEGVGREACLLRAGFRVEPGFAAARRATQDATLVLANPWKSAMTGTVSVLAPDALGLEPKVQRFSIEPLGEGRIPVSFSVPFALEAGHVPVRVLVEGMAGEPFAARLSATLEVGYRDVRVEHGWRLARSIESGAVDLVLTTRVTNLTERPLDVEAFAAADGYTQTKKPVTGLAPGQSAVRVFHFAAGARHLSGREIRAGVQDSDGDVRLLRRVPIPPLLPPETRLAAGEEQ